MLGGGIAAVNISNCQGKTYDNRTSILQSIKIQSAIYMHAYVFSSLLVAIHELILNIRYRLRIYPRRGVRNCDHSQGLDYI